MNRCVETKRVLSIPNTLLSPFYNLLEILDIIFSDLNVLK